MWHFGIADVVIGAPYEDGGKGAVYVYHGPGSCDCTMEDKYSQRIAGLNLVDPCTRDRRLTCFQIIIECWFFQLKDF